MFDDNIVAARQWNQTCPHRRSTRYDQEHLVTYLRVLDADAEGADWAEVARIVLHIDPERAWRAWISHLAQAKRTMEHGYRQRRVAIDRPVYDAGTSAECYSA